MLKATTIQERLWELRKDKGLNREELAQQTGISKSALASYEANDNKEINHGNLVTLADFYEVSLDYLFCRTENREQINTPLMELHLNDEMVALLKSGRINNRLLCEIATNDKFEQLMTDTEIYIDGHATSTFRTLYETLEEQRQTIIQKYNRWKGACAHERSNYHTGTSLGTPQGQRLKFGRIIRADGHFQISSWKL